MTIKTLPSVFSVSRSMNIGEGLFFSKTNNGDIPVEVVVEGWRGTQAENKKGNADEAANIGTSEFARLVTETSVLNQHTNWWGDFKLKIVFPQVVY